MDIKQLKAEIKNLKDMLNDAMREASVFNELSDFLQVEECSIRITHLAKQIQLREKHLQDHINFQKIISDLSDKGIIVEAVKRFELEVLAR